MLITALMSSLWAWILLVCLLISLSYTYRQPSLAPPRISLSKVHDIAVHDIAWHRISSLSPAIAAELDAEHTELARVPGLQLKVVVLAARVIRGVITWSWGQHIILSSWPHLWPQSGGCLTSCCTPVVSHPETPPRPEQTSQHPGASQAKLDKRMMNIDWSLNQPRLFAAAWSPGPGCRRAWSCRGTRWWRGHRRGRVCHRTPSCCSWRPGKRRYSHRDSCGHFIFTVLQLWGNSLELDRMLFCSWTKRDELHNINGFAWSHTLTLSPPCTGPWRSLWNVPVFCLRLLKF